MKPLSSSVVCLVASLLTAATLPAYGKGSSCVFRASGTLGLAFTLDPSRGSVEAATASVEVGDCNPSAVQAMSVTVDQGQRQNRTMQRDAGTELIPYSIGPVTIQGGNAAPGNDNYKVANFTGTVQPAAYVDAVAGRYTDRLIVTVSP